MKPVSTGTPIYTAAFGAAGKPQEAGNTPAPGKGTFAAVHLTPIAAPASVARADMTPSKRASAAIQSMKENYARAAGNGVYPSRKSFWNAAFENETKDATRELAAAISAYGEDVY